MNLKIRERIRDALVPDRADSVFMISLLGNLAKRRLRRRRRLDFGFQKMLAVVLFSITSALLAIVLALICWMTQEPLAVVIAWPKVQHIAGILAVTGVAMFLFLSHLAR